MRLARQQVQFLERLVHLVAPVRPELLLPLERQVRQLLPARLQTRVHLVYLQRPVALFRLEHQLVLARPVHLEHL